MFCEGCSRLLLRNERYDRRGGARCREVSEGREEIELALRVYLMRLWYDLFDDAPGLLSHFLVTGVNGPSTNFTQGLP